MTTAIATDEAFAPLPLPFHHEPLKVADDTYLIRSLYGEGTAPVAFYVNSMVIAGREPVIIDTGTEGNRDHWMDDVFSIVDPKAVRWVFLSHDDHDHVGNLGPVLEACCNATLISTWFQVERLAGDYNLPLDRMRWINDGEAFDAGDRVLYAIRPPIFDSPTTRGLYDSRSKVYWASDCFATPVLKASDDVNELDNEFWTRGFTMAQSIISPWHTMLDGVKYNKAIDRIVELKLSAIAGAHTPVLTGGRIDEAFDLLRQLPSQPEAQLPGQSDLEATLVALGSKVAL